VLRVGQPPPERTRAKQRVTRSATVDRGPLGSFRASRETRHDRGGRIVSPVAPGYHPILPILNGSGSVGERRGGSTRAKVRRASGGGLGSFRRGGAGGDRCR